MAGAGSRMGGIRTVLYEWDNMSPNALDTDGSGVPYRLSTSHIFDVFLHATQHAKANAMQSAKFLSGLATLLGRVGLTAKKHGKQPNKVCAWILGPTLSETPTSSREHRWLRLR